ncbi:hypothetical protein [Streptomyces sp. NPDC005336]|uniref:hypothetical protein n=1 Tax=Streptomyces sp. NPDC005336 TaxID=3157035 RepID=UPI0033A3856F
MPGSGVLPDRTGERAQQAQEAGAGGAGQDNAKPFTWTATAGEILAKVRLVATSVKKLVNNNSN